MAVARTKIAMPVEHKTEDRQFTTAQQNAQATTRVVNGFPFMNGVLLDSEVTNGIKTAGITFTAGQLKRLTHSLGRVPVGFIVVDLYGGWPVFARDPTPVTGTTSTFISIQASAGAVGTAKFWVY